MQPHAVLTRTLAVAAIGLMLASPAGQDARADDAPPTGFAGKLTPLQAPLPIRVRSGYALACDVLARAASDDAEGGAATRRWTSVVERDGGTFYHLAIVTDGLQMSGSAPVDRRGRIGKFDFRGSGAEPGTIDEEAVLRLLSAAAELAYSGTTIDETGQIELPGVDVLLRASLPAAAQFSVRQLSDDRRVGGLTRIDGEDYLVVHNDAAIKALVDGVELGLELDGYFLIHTASGLFADGETFMTASLNDEQVAVGAERVACEFTRHNDG